MASKKSIETKEITDIISPETDFIKDICEIADTVDTDLFDIILTWCHKKNIEIEQIIPLIKSNPKFKKRLQEQAKSLHFLKDRKS
jgi:hypothetical protein